MSSYPYQNFGSVETPQQAPFFTPTNSLPYAFHMPSLHQPEMVSRNYRPNMEKSSIDLNRETSSTSIFETQPEHGVEGLFYTMKMNQDIKVKSNGVRKSLYF